MTRWFYSLVAALLLPVALARLWWKGRIQPAYRERWLERLGGAPWLPDRPRLWVHAVSVGETVAAAPMVRHWQTRHPDWSVLVTTTTPTGSAQVRRLFGDSVEHCYLPFDLPWMARAFLRRTRPSLAVVMETEIWPNLYHACHRDGLPLIMANARLSVRSHRGYQRLRWLVAPTLRQVTLIAARGPEDAQRFIDLGAEPQQVQAWGDLKFDVSVPDSALRQGSRWREWWGASRPVWIAASTHAGEDAQVLAAHRQVLTDLPDALLVLAPRHPERVPSVLEEIRQAGLQPLCRSGLGATAEAPDETTSAPTAGQVLVVDTLGELMTFYAAADVAFVGGSLVPTGGHNPLEPLALGKPTLTGPHVFNFEGLYAELSALGGTTTVTSASALGQAVLEVLTQPEAHALATPVVDWLRSNQGNTARLLSFAEELLPLTGDASQGSHKP
jgi:3-deoxy-D-manno-octulosonic-acid transferase